MSTRVLFPAAGLVLAAAGTSGCGGDPPSQPLDAVAIARVSPESSQGHIGRLICEPLIVQVTDDQGAGVGGVGLNWTVISGAGEFWAPVSTPFFGGDFPRDTRTDLHGLAKAYFGPSAAGPIVIGVTADGVPGQQVTFTVAATPPTPSAAGPRIYGSWEFFRPIRRYVLNEDGTFRYEIRSYEDELLAEFSGTYATGCGGISLTFSNSDWKAKGYFEQNGITLVYNLAAIQADFENGHFLLETGAGT
jgi:hypothetical protein